MNAVTGRVAIITGGASGIGLRYAKELLKNGLKAVTLADVSPQNGDKAVQEINKEFGPDRALFVETDVTNEIQFEDAFKSTINKFKNIDILVNNAGVMNDAIWEKQIQINVVGTVNGCLLALENYIPKYKTESEGVVVNISSIAGIDRYPSFPIYAGTKHAVVGLTRAWGTDIHFVRTKVRFVALCPGVTDTPLVHDMVGRTLGPPYQKILTDHLPRLKTQPPENVAKGLVHVINNGKNGSVWVAEHNGPPYEMEIPSRQQIRKKA